MADRRDNPTSRERSGLPGWVKMLGIVVAVLVLLVIAVMLVGGGGHRPRRHGGAGRDEPPPIHIERALASQATLASPDSPRTVMDDHSPSSRQRRFPSWDR